MDKRESAWRRVLRAITIVVLILIAVMVVIVVRPDPVMFIVMLGVILVVLCYARSAWSDFQVWITAVYRSSSGK